MFVRGKRRILFLSEYFLHAASLQLCLGILLGALFRDMYSWGGLAGIFLVLVFLVDKRKTVSMVFVGLVIMGIRVFVFDKEQVDIFRNDLIGEEIVAEVRISSDFKLESTQARYVTELRKLKQEKEWIPADGKIMIYANRYPPKREGEIVVIQGTLKDPEIMNTDDFRYGDYLRNKEIAGVIFRCRLKSTGRKDLGYLKGFMLNIREGILKKIKSLLPEPHAGLLAGILFGVEAEMPEDFAESLRLTGTTHIIAASGYNITLLIGLANKIFCFLRKRIRDWVCLLSIWIYVIFLGGSLPIVRAAIMGTIGVWARMRGYEAVPVVSLVLSGAVLLLINPQNIDKISFQLSMLSSFGLIFLVPIFEVIYFPSIIGSIKEELFTTISAVLVTAPVIVGNFGTFSIVAIAANILVAPLIEVIMFLGSVVMLFPRRLCPAVLISMLWAVEEGFVRIVKRLGDFPFAYIKLESHTGILACLIFFIIMLLILFYYPEKGIDSTEAELEYLIL